MTEEQRQIAIAVVPEMAVRDFTAWIEDMVIHRPLNADEKKLLSVKCGYWMALSELKGKLLFERHVLETMQFRPYLGEITK